MPAKKTAKKRPAAKKAARKVAKKAAKKAPLKSWERRGKKKPKTELQAAVPASKKASPVIRRRARAAPAIVEKTREGFGDHDFNGFDISEGYRIRLEAFLAEYVKDGNAKASAQRMGSPDASAHAVGWQMLQEPYLQKRLADIMATLEESDLVKRDTVLAGLLHEARTADKAAARVAAWKAIGQIKGMFKIQMDVNTNAPTSGVMFIPCAGTLEAWEQTTKAEQAKLKETVGKDN